MSGNSNCSDQRECNKDLITEKIALLREHRGKGVPVENFAQNLENYKYEWVV